MKILAKVRKKVEIATLMALMLIMQGCPEAPEFDNMPKIDFVDLETYEIEVEATDVLPSFTEDVIEITIGYEDGDGNIGHTTQEAQAPGSPFRPFDLVVDFNGNPITIGSSDTLPDFNPQDYIVDSLFQGDVFIAADTFLIRRNPRHNNLFIDFYYSPPSANGDFTPLDESIFGGQSFDVTIPPINTEDYDRPLNGTVNHTIKASGMKAFFRNYPIYLEIYILDRDGNKSNVIQTPTFTFQ